MKNLISFIFFTLLAGASSGQVNATLFASLPNDINYISIKGNELYVAESVFFSGNITKLDLTQPNPAPVMVLSDIGVTSMDFIGNHLYYIKNAYELGVIDVSLPNPIASTIYNWSANNLYMKKVVSDGTQLFVLEIEADSNGLGVKFEISSISPLPTPIRTVLYSTTDEIQNFDYEDGYIYFPNLTKQTLEKISTTNGPNPMPISVSNDMIYFSGIKVVNSALFASAFDIIYRYNLNETNPIGTEYTTPLPIWPFWMDNRGNTLYFTESQLSKDIYKVDISTLSNAQDLSLGNNNLTLSPNPSKDFVAIQGLQHATNYQIIAPNGTVVRSGLAETNQPIDIQDFASGLYFLLLENGSVLKIIKE
jgi:hypothetical protein